MSREHLSVYLNDHLAGSAAGLELISDLQAIPGYEEWAARLHREVSEDRDQLETLMRKADISQNTARKAAAWLTEKVVQLKTRLDDRGGGPLQKLELVEALALGIDGKRALWTALRAVSGELPRLNELDYDRLIQRAEQQRGEVESARLRAAAEAFGPP